MDVNARPKDLPVGLRKDSDVPLYVQLKEQFRLLVRRGVLRPGDVMPPVRRLARQLEVNANTVAGVYRDLQRDGLLILRRGVGTMVGAGRAGGPISAEDFGRIEGKVDELVQLARATGLSRAAVRQILEMRWREAQ